MRQPNCKKLASLFLRIFRVKCLASVQDSFSSEIAHNNQKPKIFGWSYLYAYHVLQCPTLFRWTWCQTLFSNWRNFSLLKSFLQFLFLKSLRSFNSFSWAGNLILNVSKRFSKIWVILSIANADSCPVLGTLGVLSFKLNWNLIVERGL